MPRYVTAYCYCGHVTVTVQTCRELITNAIPSWINVKMDE